MYKIKKYKNYFFLAIFFLSGIIYAQPTLGLTSAANTGEADASSKAFSEEEDGIIYLKVQNITYDYNTRVYLNVERTLGNWGTAMLWDNMLGGNANTALRDDYTNITYVNQNVTNDWQLSIEQTVLVADGATQYFPVKVNIIDDLRYEPGAAETINLSLTAISAGGNLTVGLNEFEYQITDNDQKPKYEFVETETQTVSENNWIGSTGKVQAVAHSDGNVYVVGTNSFTIDYTITNITTSDNDHRADGSGAGDKTGTLVLYEWDYHSGGSVADANGHNLDHYLTDDSFDEPNETFSITISSSDSDDGLVGSATELDFIVTDAVDDLAPYIKFRDADVTISENGDPRVSVVAQLHQASGYDNVSCGYTISGTATATGDRADHNLASDVLTFGNAGDTEQSIIFDLIDDAWDEGLDASEFETIIITFDGTQASNVRVDAGGATYRDSFTFQIQDNDNAPTISFSTNTSITDDEDSEGTQTPEINVVLDAPSGLDITATYAQNSDGTATIWSSNDAPWDFKLNGENGSGTVTIPAFETQGNIPVTINTDESFDEANETVMIDVTSGDNVGGGTFTWTYTIIDDDQTPTLYFSNHTTEITSTENGSANRTDGTIEVQLSAPSGRQVDYTISVDSYDGNGYGSDGVDNDGDGTNNESGEGAADADDFVLNASSGSISPYGTGKSSTITYTHYGDNTDELDKYIKLVVALGSSNQNATVASGDEKYQIIKLEDDEDPIALSINQDIFSGTEGEGPYNIVISKPADKTTEFTVKTTISVANASANDGVIDDDFDLSYNGNPISSGASQIVEMGPGVTTTNVVLSIDNDDLYETSTDETIDFSLGTFVNSAIGTGTLTFSIADNEDAPTIEFDTDVSKSIPSGEEATNRPDFTVKTSHRSILPAIVNVAVTNPSTFLNGDDYTLNDAVVTVPAGETSVLIDLRIENDSRYEEAENFTITLSDAGNAHTTIGTALNHVYTINESDDKPTLSFASATTNDKSEEDATFELTVSLSTISGINSTVDYAITGTADHSGENADYTDATGSGGTLSWSGNTDKDKKITLNFVDDKIDELKETIVITLSNITGGAQTGGTMVHTINLGDSDSPPPVGLDIAGDASTNAITQEEGAIFIPKIVVKDGYSTDIPINIIWSIDEGATTAIIDGQDNEDFQIADKNGTVLSDYSGLSEADRTIVLPANTQSMNLLQISTPADGLWEQQEQLVFRIATPTSASGYDAGGSLINVDGSIDNGQNVKTVTINNAASESQPKASITASNSGNEAETNTTFTITLSANGSGASKAGLPIYVTYALGANSNNAAEEGASEDFVLPADGRLIQIPAYASSVTKTITLKDDAKYEYDEDIVIDLTLYGGSSDSAAVIDSDNNTYTYTIIETDDPPVLEFADVDGNSIDAITYDESNDLARDIYIHFKSSGTQLAEMPVIAYLTVNDGESSALNGTDFGSDASPAGFATDFDVTIAAESADPKSSFNFYAIVDSRYENDQTAVFYLNTYTEAELPSGKSNPSNATSATSEKMTITIKDVDDSPVVEWVDKTGNSGNLPYPASSGERNVNEDSGPGYFTLQLATFSEREVIVNYSVIETQSLSDPPNLVATGGTASAYPVDYRYWTSGTDGVGSSSELNASDKTGSVTFSAVANNINADANRQYINIEIPINTDNINEWSESISLQINDGATDKLVILDDDDPPKVKFTSLSSGNDVDEQVLQGSSPSFEIAIFDPADGITGIATGKDIYFSVTTNDANASYAIADPGTDFTAKTDTEADWIRMPAATSTSPQTQTFFLSIIDDAIDEENQEVTMTLAVKGADFNSQKNFNSEVSGFDERPADAATLIDASKTHVYTIKDDDPTPVAYFYEENSDVATTADTETQSVEEKYDESSIPGTKTIKVKTDGDSEKTITIYYAAITSDADCPSEGNCASPDNDYDKIPPNSSLEITPDDNNEKTFTITTIDDDRDEYDQDVIIQLSTNASSNATISSASDKPGKYRLIIVDQDPVPDVNFTLGVRNQPESTASGNSTIQLSIPTEKDVTIGYEVSSTESDFGIFVVNDLDDANGLVIWPEDVDMTYGKTTANITGLADDVANETMSYSIQTNIGTDTNDEWDEKFKIEIDAATSVAVNKGSNFSETIITIQDDDDPEIVQFTSNPATGSNAESNNSYNLELSILEPSGKNIAIKYSITRSDNPNDKDHGTKGIDYNFGSSPNDSIVTISSQSLTGNIPLTILDDSIYEEDQDIEIRISLSNTYPNDSGNGYYNSLSASAGVEATIGDRDLYKYTIIDNEDPPVLHFGSDVPAFEGSELSNVSVPVYLKDDDGALLTSETGSERSVSVQYVLDTDNSIASEDEAPPTSKYEDDFDFENGTLEFTPITYNYNPITDSYLSSGDEENVKNITFDIYGDDLYELDEALTINLSEASFVNADTDNGDHSFIYTIKNDDARPEPYFEDENLYTIAETNPGDNTAISYTSSAVKIYLDRESGTDVFIVYSQKDYGANDNYDLATVGEDFNLDEDDTDLNQSGKKSVTIPANTSSELGFSTIDIELLSDNIVEQDEKFILQIDNYRDKDSDGNLVNNPEDSDQETTILISDDDNAPAAQAPSEIFTLASDDDKVNAAIGHWDPVTAGYWNEYNTGLTIKVPIEDTHGSLKDGKIKLQAGMTFDNGETFSSYDIPDVERIITEEDINTVESYTFELTALQFEGTDANPTAWFAEGYKVYFRSIVSDKYVPANSDTSNWSSSTITIDEISPSTNNYVVESVISKLGNEVSSKWNGTNDSLQVTVKFQNEKDLTVNGGSLLLFAGIGDNPAQASYDTLGSSLPISSDDNEVGRSITFTIEKDEVIAIAGFGEDKYINFYVEVVDIAGNKSDLPFANDKLFIDTIAPKIVRVESVDSDGNEKNGIFGIDSLINLKFTFSENISLTAGSAEILFDATMSSKPEINSSDLINKITHTVSFTVEEGESSALLEFISLTPTENNKLQDAAGNDMIVFTAEEGFSLEDLSIVEVDGNYPSSFNIDTLIVQGSNSVLGYWNSNSTSIIFPLKASYNFNDNSLIGGQFQIEGIVEGDTIDIGIPTVLVESEADGGGLEPAGDWNSNNPKDYGEIGVVNLHFEIDRSSIESAFSSSENYPDKSAADPEQLVILGFRAKLSDRAGNTIASDTIPSLTIDEVIPLDPAMGLPSNQGYSYTIEPQDAMDNYVDIIPVAAAENSVSRPGWFNGTNTGITFKSWIAYDNPNSEITIDRDISLINGLVQVQMTTSPVPDGAVWTDIGIPDTITQSDIDAGYITSTIPRNLIEESSAFGEGATVYFRNKVRDKAGNITEQSTISSKNIKIDETPPAFANLEYSRKYVNGTDHNPIITVKFDTGTPETNDPKNFPYDAPKLTAVLNIAEPDQFITSQSMTIINNDNEIDSSSYYFELLDVPGERGDSQFDTTITISIEATDKAGNFIVQEVITNKTYLEVDNTPPTVEFQYINTTNELSPSNAGRYGDGIQVIAVLSEQMKDSPDDENPVGDLKLSADPLSNQITTNIFSNLGGYYVAFDSDFDSSSTVKFNVDLLDVTDADAPQFENQDINLEFRLEGTDYAENPVDTLIGYTGGTHQVFKFDNKAPTFSNFNISDNAFINTTALDWSNDNDALMSSASIRFEPVLDYVNPPPIGTEGNPIALLTSGTPTLNELSRTFNPPSPYFIQNDSILIQALADSNTYDVIFKGTDLVGNVDSITINNVTYDTKNPTVEVEYVNKYITALEPEPAGTRINLTFNEIQRVAPKIKLYYGGILSQNAEGASWVADDLITTFIDTLSSDKIKGPYTLTNADPLSGDSTGWYYIIDPDSVMYPEPPEAFDGYVWVRVISQDLAGNSFVNNTPASIKFDGPTNEDDNFLYLDNTQPKATFTYANLRDSSLTMYNADNESESYCCFAIAGDSVLVKVEMNEAIVYDASDTSNVPQLNLQFNYLGQDSVTNGSVDSDITPFPISAGTELDGINFDDDFLYDDIDPNEKTANVFHYKIGIKDGVNNNGTLKLTLNAKDISGTPITMYGFSPQKADADSSQYALEIDNIHPWGIPGDSIFVEPIDSVTFPTEQFTTTGFREIENWINNGTEFIHVGVPYQNPSSDNSISSNNPDWGPQGKIDVQLKNFHTTNLWQTIGSADIISFGTPQTIAVGGYFLRTVSRSVSDFKNNPTMINQDTTASNELQFRGVITDKNGNVTFGQPSDAYKVNSDGLYLSDLLNTDDVGYDIVAPDLGSINDGNFDTDYVFGDTLRIISNDTITVSWSEFIDPGEDAASGVDLYEMQVYTYPSWTVTVDESGQPIADTTAMTDSLFTVDMNLDGIDDPGHWYKIYKEQAPSFNNPITLNTLDSVVIDSFSNTSIVYDYNDTLKHETYYMIAIRAFDIAGNASDTIYTNAIQRYNSAPVFVDNLTNLTLYEDIAWDYDTVKVSDLDLSTLQGDSFTYTISPKKIVSNETTGFDTNLVLINPPVVDESTGLVSWTPIQDTTVDQSGNYLFTFKVEDVYGFKDSIVFNAIVNAVNDTPIVDIFGDDKVLTWREDKPASEIVKINLSNYVQDIDNADSSLSWQFVIMDTSQLDEDFPLASVIVGPGTPKAVQTKMMREYLGFDPSKGIDMPTLAKKSGNSTMQMLTNADSYISIDIDTSIPDSTIATFTSDSNYHGSNHRIIFSAIDPFGALDMDTIIVNIIPENDPPVVTEIDTIFINENDSIWIDFSQFTSDIDDTTLTFKIEGVYNTDSINYVSEPYLSDGVGDTVLFDPFDLWSGFANFRVTASDEEAESSQLFTLKVLRVPRPDIQVSLVQNNAFSSYVSIIITDKVQKTRFLQLEVQNQRINIDTVAAYTYTGDFSFGIGGGYSFDILAVGEVGRTIYTNTFNLAPARVSNRWYANSSDGRFSVAGDPGSVDTDQSFLIVDSSLFISNFSDQASYVLGEETYMFAKPIEVHFGSLREDLSIYQRENGVIWKELPSINRNGQVLTFTENAGYFRLGPKTIIVPEETDLHQNYPNPFNPYTTIKYDIGLMDGINQKVSVNVYNLSGQHVTTLINNVSQVGQFYVKWDGSDKFGKILPSGIYFIQLKTDSGIIKNKKMMFLK